MDNEGSSFCNPGLLAAAKKKYAVLKRKISIVKIKRQTKALATKLIKPIYSNLRHILR